MEEIRVGDIVIPISKSTGSVKSLGSESNWQRACERGQNYLFVIEIKPKDHYDPVTRQREDVYVLSHSFKKKSGNFFLRRDLMLAAGPNRSFTSFLKQDGSSR